MRCIARAFLISAIFICLLIYFAVQSANAKITEEWDQRDVEARRILEGIKEGETSIAESTPLSVSVAIVLVISLISIALLITGIIIVAVTLDPNTSDEESDVESEGSSNFQMDYRRRLSAEAILEERKHQFALEIMRFHEL